MTRRRKVLKVTPALVCELLADDVMQLRVQTIGPSSTERESHARLAKIILSPDDFKAISEFVALHRWGEQQ